MRACELPAERDRTSGGSCGSDGREERASRSLFPVYSPSAPAPAPAMWLCAPWYRGMWRQGQMWSPYCGLRVTRECPPARVRPGYWSRLRAVVCELSEGAVGNQVDRRIELASGRRTVGRAEQKEQGWEGGVRRWHCQEERGRRMWKRWEPGFGLGGRHWWHTGETLTRFGELDTMMSADVDYKYWSTKVLGSQTNQT